MNEGRSRRTNATAVAPSSSTSAIGTVQLGSTEAVRKAPNDSWPVTNDGAGPSCGTTSRAPVASPVVGDCFDVQKSHSRVRFPRPDCSSWMIAGTHSATPTPAAMHATRTVCRTRPARASHARNSNATNTSAPAGNNVPTCAWTANVASATASGSNQWSPAATLHTVRARANSTRTMTYGFQAYCRNVPPSACSRSASGTLPNTSPATPPRRHRSHALHPIAAALHSTAPASSPHVGEPSNRYGTART